MRTVSLSLTAAVLLATVSFAPAQTPAPTATPAASAAPEKHHRAKKAAAAATSSPTPAASPAAAAAPEAAPSPSPAKMTRAQKKAAKTNGAAPAAPAETPGATIAPGGGSGLVWVNTKTHKYHKEGSHFYGRTKEGKYMSEQDAIAEGDHESAHRKTAETPKPQ